MQVKNRFASGSGWENVCLRIIHMINELMKIVSINQRTMMKYISFS